MILRDKWWHSDRSNDKGKKRAIVFVKHSSHSGHFLENSDQRILKHIHSNEGNRYFMIQKGVDNSKEGHVVGLKK